MTNLPLNKAIASLRHELKSAIEASDPQLPLEVQELELELSLEVENEVGAEAGANLWSVVTGKFSAKDADRRLHRLRIVLNPQTLDDGGEPRRAKLSSQF